MKTMLLTLIFGALSIGLVGAPTPALACPATDSPFTGRFTGVLLDVYQVFEMSVTLKISKDGEIKGHDAEMPYYPNVRLRVTGEINESGFAVIVVQQKIAHEWEELFTYQGIGGIDSDGNLGLLDGRDYATVSILRRE